MTKTLYFDSSAGISGDMTIGALLDLGVAPDKLKSGLAKLNLTGYQLKINKRETSGVAGTDFQVQLDTDLDQAGYQHRNLTDIREIITASDLSQTVKELSEEIFTVLAEAEAKVHDKPITEVHFHEVGAIDSIVDIVGTAICIEQLAPTEIYFSPLPVGTGTVDCAHGKLPLPAPATAELLTGIPVYSPGIKSELVTPTGAAIAKVLADEFKPLPELELNEIGYGLGDKKLEIANLLRVVSGSSNSTEKLVMLETNIDDLQPEIYSYLYSQLFAAGACDVYLTEIKMKKNRPGIKLSVLAQTEDIDQIEDILFKETTTLGLRKYEVDRKALERKFFELETKWGTVTIKAGFKDGELVTYAPEYEECQQLAREFDLPLKEVYEQIRVKARDDILNHIK